MHGFDVLWKKGHKRKLDEAYFMIGCAIQWLVWSKNRHVVHYLASLVMSGTSLNKFRGPEICFQSFVDLSGIP